MRKRRLTELTIDDEAVFRTMPYYQALKEALVDARYKFRVLPSRPSPRFDRALLLNLTFWGGGDGDVLADDHVPADVVAHAAWHHVAARAFLVRGQLSVDALFLGEAIASAFDLFMVGHLLNRPARAPRSSFLDTQVPAMAASADAAGLSAARFQRLLTGIAADPGRAFMDLRALLVDVTSALMKCRDPDRGLAVLQRYAPHRFACLLHRFELSNWVLWARAWAGDRQAPDPRVRRFERALRAAPDGLAFLDQRMLRAAKRD